jgi:hypothetical protein
MEDEMGGACSTNGGEQEGVQVTDEREITRKTMMQVGG